MIHLDEGEVVHIMVRKHWFHFLRDITLFLVSVLVPVILYVSYQILPHPKSLEFTGDVRALWIFFVSIWALVSWTTLFVAWTDYYLDVLIITNMHIFDIEQKGLFSRESSSFRLDRIQDITVEIDGIIATFLNFGKIHIQTAGEDRIFVAGYIPRPETIKDLIKQEQGKAIERLSLGSKS